MEVAKLRAARTLWHRVMDGLGAKDERSKMLRTHCQTSGVSLQEQDPYNNVIRTTIEAMAATLGGTQSLHTNALDEAIALPTDFSARIARNTQIVLAEESGITRVVDPLGGSYYVEALTQMLVDDCWKLIEEVDALGGMTKAVATGMPKQRIEEAAAARQARVDKGEDVIVGVNKYRLAKEEHLDTLSIDNHAVRDGQIARLKTMRAERDEAKCQAALAALTEGARYSPNGGGAERSEAEGGQTEKAAVAAARSRAQFDPPPSVASGDTSPSGGVSSHNLLALAVEAARARASLGEISDAMEAVFGRYGTQPVPVTGIYGEAYADDSRYQQVIEGVQAVARRLGRSPRLLVAKMGQDGHDRGANVIASAFTDMDFDVTSSPLFQTPEETLALALEKEVDAIGASSLAAGHKTLIPELIRLLREAGRADIKVVAGGVIPPQDYDFLREAGVQGIYGPGSNVVECSGTICRRWRGRRL
jgi:methylmalonyl-CoA mutase